MDLREYGKNRANRHPWETARSKALAAILRPHLFERIKVLDVGCGDGFISTGLFSHLQAKKITAVDINLSDEQIHEFNRVADEITYRREIPDNAEFDLVLLLDVLEHVKDDAGFLAAIVEDQLQSSGRILITVPAFQSIYGRHDINLGDSFSCTGGLSRIALTNLFKCEIFTFNMISCFKEYKQCRRA